jgi:ribosome-binding factor A
LQSKIADRIDLRYTPRLTFVLDQGVKHSIAVAQILREVLPPENVAEPAEQGGEGPPEDEDLPAPQAGQPGQT